MKRYLSFILMAVMLLSSPKCVVMAIENVDKVNVSMVGKYDSADTAAIRDIDTVRKRIRFRNHSTGKTYTLTYDNTSMIYDARGTVLSASLLEVGQIVDVTFLKSSRHITTMNVSKDAWVIKDTKDHELVRGDGTAKIKGEVYKIDARTLVMADGNLALAEDVLATDTVTVSGIGKDIYSVMVTGGHGYVSLSSDVVEDHSLVGAWIELDNAVIHKISPNMLLSAPEGDYNLQIIGNGANYQSEVTISRNQETVVDTSNVEIERPKEGLVTFEIIPENAEVFVDGEKVLTGVTQSIRYGFHNLKIMADGYITQDKYLKIGTPKSVINIELEKEKTEESSETTSSSSASSEASSNADSGASYTSVWNTGSTVAASLMTSQATEEATVSANSSSESTTNKVIEGYKIYFDKPYDAELYFDGAYVGMVPTNVVKISGSHEVILKKDGYETKSYRISIDSDKVDLSYTFPDLVKIAKEEDSSGGSASSASTASSASSSASTGDSGSGSSSASTGDSGSGSSSASTGDSGTGSSSASTGDSGTGSSSASTGDSGTGSSSASTGDSGTGSNTGATGDTPSTDNTSGTGATETSSEAATAISGPASETSSAAPGEATTPSESVGGNTNETGTSQADQPSDAASTGSTINQEGAADAASAASGG